jgi:hypothetical protein
VRQGRAYFFAAFLAGAAAFLAGAAAFFAGAAAFFAGAAFAAALAGAFAAGFFAGAFMAVILFGHRFGAGVSEVRMQRTTDPTSHRTCRTLLGIPNIRQTDFSGDPYR